MLDIQEDALPSSPFSYELLHVTMQNRLYHHPYYWGAVRFHRQSLTVYSRLG